MISFNYYRLSFWQQELFFPSGVVTVHGCPYISSIVETNSFYFIISLFIQQCCLKEAPSLKKWSPFKLTISSASEDNLGLLYNRLNFVKAVQFREFQTTAQLSNQGKTVVFGTVGIFLVRYCLSLLCVPTVQTILFYLYHPCGLFKKDSSQVVCPRVYESPSELSVSYKLCFIELHNQLLYKYDENH